MKQPVAKVEPMPGVPYFGMAVFNTSDVPIGSELFTAPEHMKGWGFNSPQELLFAYAELKFKVEKLERTARWYEEVREKGPTLTGMAKALKCRVKDVRECLAKGDFDIPRYNLYQILTAEEVAYLINNFKEQQ